MLTSVVNPVYIYKGATTMYSITLTINNTFYYIYHDQTLIVGDANVWTKHKNKSMSFSTELNARNFIWEKLCGKQTNSRFNLLEVVKV